MKFSKEFIVTAHQQIDLSKFNSSDTAGFEKEDAKLRTEKNVVRMFKQQYLLAAEKKRSLLIVLQGMDTAGKDGVIRHVMRGLNPQDCDVTSFKQPSNEELSHDFLWRVHKAVPPRGNIGIFNRSHYEDVLIARVKGLVPKDVWTKRYDQINHFEKILTENGMTILKFFLHISKKEQKNRLEERLDDPTKNWKLTESDVKERRFWKEYRKAYEDVLRRCSTHRAPWFIIPSDKKWFRDLAVSEIIYETLDGMDLKTPAASLDLKKIKII